MARQFQELYEFFDQLNTLRWLKTAEGAQLDGIGDIVVLSRADALVLSNLIGLNVPMDDDTYRIYLAFKIHLNTSNATHKDIYSGIRMFWDGPLYYSEQIEHPATIFYSTPTLTPEDNVTPLLLAPKIKAGGVALKILAATETPPEEPFTVRVAGVTFPGSIMITKLPQYIPADKHEQEIHTVAFRSSIMQTTLGPIHYEHKAVISLDGVTYEDAKLQLPGGEIVGMVIQMLNEDMNGGITQDVWVRNTRARLESAGKITGRGNT